MHGAVTSWRGAVTSWRGAVTSWRGAVDELARRGDVVARCGDVVARRGDVVARRRARAARRGEVRWWRCGAVSSLRGAVNVSSSGAAVAGVAMVGADAELARGGSLTRGLLETVVIEEIRCGRVYGEERAYFGRANATVPAPTDSRQPGSR